MAPNCSAYILAWLGSSLAQMAEVPINTAYRGTFLEHQASTVAPRLALIHPDFAERFAESAGAVRTVERFYLAGGTAAERAGAASALHSAGFAVSDWEELLQKPPHRRRGRIATGAPLGSGGRSSSPPARRASPRA